MLGVVLMGSVEREWDGPFAFVDVVVENPPRPTESATHPVDGALRQARSGERRERRPAGAHRVEGFGEAPALRDQELDSVIPVLRLEERSGSRAEVG